MSETITVGDCNTYVENIFLDCGTTMMDEIENLINQINEAYDGENGEELHEAFTTKLAHITYYWRTNKLITAGERATISSCAWNADILYYNEQ